MPDNCAILHIWKYRLSYGRKRSRLPSVEIHTEVNLLASVTGGDIMQYITWNDLFGYTESVCAVLTVVLALIAILISRKK